MRALSLSRLPVGVLVGIFAVFGLGPLLVLAYVSVTRASTAVTDQVTARARSTAVVSADLVQSEVLGLSQLVEAYAQRRTLIAALGNGDPARYRRADIAFNLRQLRHSRAGIAISFFTDPGGRLVDIVPSTPSIVGVDFSFRDWYRGVTATRRPYVSEAYVTAARGNERVVAAAALVRGPSAGGEARTLGVLVAGYSLDYIQSFVDRFAEHQGVRLTVTDQAGVLVAAPGAARGLVSVRSDPLVAAALRGESGVVTRDGAGGQELAAYVPVPRLGWTVTASVSRDAALAPVRTLRSTVVTITALLILVLFVGLTLLAWTLRRLKKAERFERESRIQTEEARRLLAERNDELEQTRSELEQQNAELESQAVQLEESHVQLAAANDELQAQQAELERTLAALADEKERIESFYRFGESLAAETGVETLAQTVLGQTGDYAHADAGALYALDPEHGDVYSLVATRGLDRARLSPTVAAGEGLTGRALAEIRALRDEQGASGLRLPGLAEEIPVLHELHIPLVHAGRPVGALVLGRTGEQGFSTDELGGIGHLADQAAVALANALALRQARRLADINKAVLDTTVDGITMLDGEGRVVVSNNAMRRLADVLGAAPGDTTEAVAVVARRTTDPDAFLAAIEARRDNPLAEISDEFTLVDPPWTIERYSAPVRREDGEVIGRIILMRDVTARREAERFKDELVATVSHELRTPLTGILGFSELLVSQEADAATRAHYVQTIHQEARRLTDLLNDFLEVERFESGRVELARRVFSLADALRAETALFAGQSEVHTLELKPADDPLEVHGDRDRTCQVIANLLSNAIKYSPGGGIVAIAAERTGHAVRVSITDRGLGIPAEQQRRVFEKFFRVDSTDTREIGGTGLGLALAKDIVEAQGGTIGFESEPGIGSTFWFELPAA